MLPSLMTTSSVPRGHLFHTQTTPPRALSVPVGQRKAGYNKSTTLVASGTLNASSSAKTFGTTSTTAVGLDLGIDSNHPLALPTRGHAASDFVYRSWHSTHKSSCRSRTEWLKKRHAQIKGEIRNLKVLGVIASCQGAGLPDDPRHPVEHLIVAYQGHGRLKTFIDHGSSVELEEVGQWEVPSDKTGANICIYGAPSEAVFNKLNSKYVDSHNHHFRFACYRRPRLPCNIMVMGESEPDGVNLLKKPCREAITKARVSSSGHVTNCQSFLVAF